jgi:hypothetical protein
MLEINVGVGGGDLPPLTKGQISRLTRSVAARVRKEVIKATPRGDRPLDPRQAKRTRDSWTPVRKDEGGYSFSNPLIQSWFLEHGSKIGSRPWPKAKARTVYNKGRVYSSQAPSGITAKANVEEVASAIASELLDLLMKGKSLAAR